MTTEIDVTSQVEALEAAAQRQTEEATEEVFQPTEYIVDEANEEVTLGLPQSHPDHITDEEAWSDAVENA